MLLISDTNIVMDLQVAGLIEALFKLPYEIGMPDIVLGTELSRDRARLQQAGLRSVEVQEEDLNRGFTTTTITHRALTTAWCWPPPFGCGAPF